MIKLETLGDVRLLIGILPKAARARGTWQRIIRQLNAAARGGDTRDLEVSLWIVMTLEHLEWQKR